MVWSTWNWETDQLEYWVHVLVLVVVHVMMCTLFQLCCCTENAIKKYFLNYRFWLFWVIIIVRRPSCTANILRTKVQMWKINQPRLDIHARITREQKENYSTNSPVSLQPIVWTYVQSKIKMLWSRGKTDASDFVENYTCTRSYHFGD